MSLKKLRPERSWIFTEPDVTYMHFSFRGNAEVCLKRSENSIFLYNVRC